jgi:hypothetical protein
MIPTLEAWKEFLSLVMDTRRFQEYYRNTLCPKTRRDLQQLEWQIDLQAERLKHQLEAALAATGLADVPAIAAATPTGEGGVP